MNNHSDNEYALIGYKLKNTLSDYGFVSRGICDVTNDSYISSVVERAKIIKKDTGIVYQDENEEFKSLSGEEIVSMNMFAFTSSIFKHYQNSFNDFLQENGDDLEAEFYLPTVINKIVKSKEAKVKVI